LGDREGPIYLFDGRLLGYHRGIHYYTIGQRRGMGLSFPYPLYVIGISSEDNAIFLGPKEYLERTRVYAAEVNLLSAPQREVTGKIRYNQREEPCEYALERNLLSVRFERPVSGVAGGQSLVLYSGDVVIGGGTIL